MTVGTLSQKNKRPKNSIIQKSKALSSVRSQSFITQLTLQLSCAVTVYLQALCQNKKELTGNSVIMMEIS